jgi:hypothetical protein
MRTYRSLMYVCTFTPMLLCASLCEAVTLPNKAVAASAGRYTFCESGQTPNRKAYVTDAFQRSFSDVRAEFANYLADAHGYHGAVKCFTLPSRDAAIRFRDQRIGNLHWNGAEHVVVADWSPESSSSVTPAAQSAVTMAHTSPD